MKKITLKIKGMHCNSCSMRISDALKEAGIKSSINIMKETAIIVFDESRMNEKEIISIIEKEGYEVEK